MKRESKLWGLLRGGGNTASAYGSTYLGPRESWNVAVQELRSQHFARHTGAGFGGGLICIAAQSLYRTWLPGQPRPVGLHAWRGKLRCGVAAYWPARVRGRQPPRPPPRWQRRHPRRERHDQRPAIHDRHGRPRLEQGECGPCQMTVMLGTCMTAVSQMACGRSVGQSDAQPHPVQSIEVGPRSLAGWVPFVKIDPTRPRAMTVAGCTLVHWWNGTPQQGNQAILLAAAGPGGMTPTTPACRAPPPSGRGTTRAGGAAAAAEEQGPCGRGRPVGRRRRRGAGPGGRARRRSSRRSGKRAGVRCRRRGRRRPWLAAGCRRRCWA
ncbi:hypothetical protein PLESTM_001799600 [Pleodorina starrii]|nr:hypothetical protein PLESTM_001799600 [Pleodorina starrii]